MTIDSLEGSDDAAGDLIVADDCLVPLVGLVSQRVGRDKVGECQRDIVDDDVIPCCQHLRAYLDLNTREDVIVITARNGVSLNWPDDCEQFLRFLVLLYKILCTRHLENLTQAHLCHCSSLPHSSPRRLCCR